MATIRTSTIDNITEFDGEFKDSQKVLIQDSNDETVTKTATVLQLKSLFGSSGKEQGNSGDTGNDTDYVVNSFNAKEYAWNISGDSGIDLDNYGKNTVESEPYTVRSATEELYIHFDVVVKTSNTSLMEYPDSYMAIQIEMNNEKDGEKYVKKWYDICRKPLCGLGQAGVASIDFHMVAQAGMSVKAYVNLGVDISGEDTIKSYINKTGTKLHIVAISLDQNPEYDYSTYLYLDSKDQVTELSIDNGNIGEFAVDAYAYGTSTATGNTQLVLMVGHENDGLEFMGKKAWYSKGSYKDGEFLGRFYCKAGASEKLRIRIQANVTSSSKPIYVLLKFHAIGKTDIGDGTVTCISSIVANTRDDLKSLMIDANGDYRLCAVQNVASLEDNDVMIEFQGREDKMSAYCEYGADVIENAGINGNKDKRIYYYGDVYTTFKGSATSAKKNTTINKIRFNASYEDLPANAFQYFNVLTDIDLSNSNTTKIGDSAFLGCTALSNVTLSKNTTTIGQTAFSGCTSLTSIILPESVRDIGQKAFNNCTALKSIQIPIELSGTIGNNICYGIKQAQASLKISVPDKCASQEAVRTLIDANITKLSYLYTAFATLKNNSGNNGTLTAQIVRRNGEEFTYKSSDDQIWALSAAISNAAGKDNSITLKPSQR